VKPRQNRPRPPSCCRVHSALGKLSLSNPSPPFAGLSTAKQSTADAVRPFAARRSGQQNIGIDETGNLNGSRDRVYWPSATFERVGESPAILIAIWALSLPTTVFPLRSTLFRDGSTIKLSPPGSAVFRVEPGRVELFNA
jgi:hypothetical protein